MKDSIVQSGVRGAQLPLGLAAGGDPLTSHLAAEELTASGRRASQKRAVMAWLRDRGAILTSAEIAAESGLGRHLVARRLPDLEADGLVERGAARVCAVSGRQAVTWSFARGGGDAIAHR